MLGGPTAGRKKSRSHEVQITRAHTRELQFMGGLTLRTGV